MTPVRRPRFRRRDLLRALAATGFVVLIAAAAGVIVHVDTAQHRIVVRAQIDENGQPVPVGNTVPADPAGNGAGMSPPPSIAWPVRC